MNRILSALGCEAIRIYLMEHRISSHLHAMISQVLHLLHYVRMQTCSTGLQMNKHWAITAGFLPIFIMISDHCNNRPRMFSVMCEILFTETERSLSHDALRQTGRRLHLPSSGGKDQVGRNHSRKDQIGRPD